MRITPRERTDCRHEDVSLSGDARLRRLVSLLPRGALFPTTTLAARPPTRAATVARGARLLACGRGRASSRTAGARPLPPLGAGGRTPRRGRTSWRAASYPGEGLLLLVGPPLLVWLARRPRGRRAGWDGEAPPAAPAPLTRLGQLEREFPGRSWRAHVPDAPARDRRRGSPRASLRGQPESTSAVRRPREAAARPASRASRYGPRGPRGCGRARGGARAGVTRA